MPDPTVTTAWIEVLEARRITYPQTAYALHMVGRRYGHVSVLGVSAGVAYVGMATLEAQTPGALWQAVSAAETALDNRETLARHEAY